MSPPTDLRTFAVAAPEFDELLSFRRVIFVNRHFAPLAGQADFRVGVLQGGRTPLPAETLPLNPFRIRSPRKSSFLSAPTPKSDFGRDRKKQGQRCAQAINKRSYLGAHLPKQVFSQTGRNRFLFPPTTYRICFLRVLGKDFLCNNEFIKH